jgi:hypothetical protein
MALLTRDPLEAGLHVLPGGGLRPERLLARYGLPLPAGHEGSRGPGPAPAPGAADRLEGIRRGSSRRRGGVGGGKEEEEEEEEEDDDGVEALMRAAGADDAGDEEEGEEGGAGAFPGQAGADVGGKPSSWAGRWKAVVAFRPTGGLPPLRERVSQGRLTDTRGPLRPRAALQAKREPAEERPMLLNLPPAPAARLELPQERRPVVLAHGRSRGLRRPLLGALLLGRPAGLRQGAAPQPHRADRQRAGRGGRGGAH